MIVTRSILHHSSITRGLQCHFIDKLWLLKHLFKKKVQNYNWTWTSIFKLNTIKHNFSRQTIHQLWWRCEFPADRPLNMKFAVGEVPSLCSFNQKNWGKNPLRCIKNKPVKSVIKSRKTIAQVHIFISESSHTEIILAAQIVSKSIYIFFNFPNQTELRELSHLSEMWALILKFLFLLVLKMVLTMQDEIKHWRSLLFRNIHGRVCTTCRNTIIHHEKNELFSLFFHF